MIGEQYGSWTIIEQVEDYTSGNSSQRQWLCRCVCGHTRKFTTYSIRKQTKPCSHIWGKRFGKLVVIAPVERPAQNKTGTFVRCKCDCGNDYICNKRSLIVGDAKSCGCSTHPFDDLTGQRIGKLLVLSRAENINNVIHWNCLCDCGNQVTRSSHYLKGTTQKEKSCGCIKGTPPNFVDLTGQRFGKLVVIEQADSVNSVGGQTKVCWRCKCDCGNTTIVKGNSLKTGMTRSCGCLKNDEEFLNSQFGDLSGMHFGDLTVINRVSSDSEKRIWLCQCSCGKTREASTYDLRSGTIYDCGHSWDYRINLVGQRFGRLKVVEKVSTVKGQIRWKCKCDCGNYTEAFASHLRSGNVRSCGCLARELTADRSLEDLTGQRFGLWTVIERVEKPEHVKHGTFWKCKCDCGNEGIVAASELKKERSRSCGCNSRSKYEMWTEEALVSMKYDYKTQVKFDNLIGINQGLLSYDFGVYKNDKIVALIECQGSQHYKPEEHFGGVDQFKRQKIHDNLKRCYAKDTLHVGLLEIPYWVKNYKETYEILKKMFKHQI